MKCFHHQENDAVGICCVCRRGVCSECARNIDKSLVCSPQCEEDAVVYKGLKIDGYDIKRQEDDIYTIWIFILVMALLFISWNLPRIIITKRIMSDQIVLLIMGGAMLLSFGISLLYNYIRSEIIKRKSGS